jgi:hypothetical protein
MDPQHRRGIIDAIERSLEEDYYRDFRELFEYVVQINNNEIPALPTNAARNYLDHFALALFESKDEITAETHIARGKKHLAIGKYDCLSISVLHKATYLEDYVLTVEAQNDQLLPPLRTRLAALKKRRRGLPNYHFQRSGRDANKETKDQIAAEVEAIEATNEKYEEVLLECNNFVEYLRDAFPISGSPQSSLARQYGRVRRWIIRNIFWIVIVGGIVNVVAGAVFVYWFEDLVRDQKSSPTSPPAVDPAEPVQPTSPPQP